MVETINIVHLSALFIAPTRVNYEWHFLYKILILIKIISTNICDFQVVTNPKNPCLSFSMRQKFNKYNMNSYPF